MTEPIRDHDAANLSLELLGLPVIPGSVYSLTDSEPPVTVVTSPTEGELLPEGERDVTGTVTDDLSGVARVRVKVFNIATGLQWNGTGWQAAGVFVDATITGNDWTLPNVDFEAGEHQIRIYSYDNEGNTYTYSESVANKRTFTIN